MPEHDKHMREQYLIIGEHVQHDLEHTSAEPEKDAPKGNLVSLIEEQD